MSAVEPVAPSNPARLSVLFVNTATLPPLGADTWIHAQIVHGLDRATHDVHVACVVDNDGEPTPTYLAMREAPGVHLRPVDFGPELMDRSWRGKLRAAWATLPAIPSLIGLVRYVRRHRIPIIHTSDRPRDALACVLLARSTRARCIIQVHVAYNAEWMGRPLRWSLRHADALIGVSEYVARTLVDGGHRASSTFAVLNAIDVPRWTPGTGREEVRREFGVGDDATLLLCACRLFPEKGPADLIRAVAEVRREEPQVRLVIVGQDVTPDHWFSRHLAELIVELDLGEQVTVAGRRPDIVALMAAADIYAMPSFEEPFGLVFAEAMAMERPVVGLDSGGTPEIVVDGETGLLSPPGDQAALVEHLLALIRDPDRRARMGAAGRRVVAEGFTVERMARDAAAVYRQVI